MLHALLQERGEVLIVPVLAAVVEAKNSDHLARGEEGFLFRPLAASHDVLKKMLKNGKADICLAFDCSERGEYNSWLWAGMIGQLSKGALQCRRLRLAALDEAGVSMAMEREEYVDSAQAACFYFEECFQRCLASHLQRLLGTRTGPGNIPLSIPVLTILTLLAEREQEVREFAGTPKWHVKLSLKGTKGEIPAQLIEVVGVCSDGTLEGKDQAKKVAEDLAGQSFLVASRQENILEIPAPQPYTLYELIIDAFRYCQIPLAEALQAAIALFAGVALGGKRQALISSLYAVTLDNVQPLVEAVGRQVEARFGKEALQSRPLSGLGIMPLDPDINPEELAGLPDVLQKIYDLIWRRALASQMAEGVGKEILLTLATEKYRLQSDARLIEEPGFLQVYQYGYGTLLSATLADTLQEEEKATVVKVVPEERFGMTSDRYSLASLVDDLGELGVERQDEVVLNLGRLCANGYVSLQKDGTLQCESNLFKVVNTLNRAFPGMQGLNLIVYYAQTIDEVTSGRKRFQMGLKQFDQNLVIQGQPLVKAKPPTSLERLNKSKNIIKSDAPPPKKGQAQVQAMPDAAAKVDDASFQDGQKAVGIPEPSTEIAAVLPEDEGVEVEIQEPEENTNGEEQSVPEQDDDALFVDEEGEEQASEVSAAEAEQLFQEAGEQLSEVPSAPSATTDAPVDSDLLLQKEGAVKGIEAVPTKPCPECGRAMVRKGDRLGQYWACTGIPACRHTEGTQEKEGDDALQCPLCHQGQLVVKRTPTGKDMYVCRRESCEFMAWSKPHAIHCPLCSSSFLVEKKGVSGKVVLRCPKAGCNYSQPRAAGDEQEAPVMRKKVVVRRVKGSSTGGGKRKVVVRRKK